jgi:hypothetical protein
MKTSVDIYNNVDEYIDVHIYITPDGPPETTPEWRAHVYWDVEHKVFVEGELAWSENQESGFDNIDLNPPREVRSAYFNALPEAFAKINQEKESQGETT